MERVAVLAFGHEVLGVGADLPADAGDGGIDGAGGCQGVVGPEGLQQFLV